MPSAPDARVVAVTGIRELLGARLIRFLDEQPWTSLVLAIDLRDWISPAKKVRSCRVDLTLPEAGHQLAELFRQHRVDTVVHLAFRNHPGLHLSQAHELQVIGTLHVLNAMAAAAVRKVVMLGSTMSYGSFPDNPNFLREENALRAREDFPFVRDWAEAERQLWDFSRQHPEMVATVLRMGAILGSHATGMIPRWLSSSVVPVVLGYDPLMQFVHQDDAARALQIAVERDVPGPFNIVADGVLPQSTILSLGGRLGLPIPHFLWDKIGSLLWNFQATNTPPFLLNFLRYLWVADGQKAREVMGFTPSRSSRETLLDFFKLEQLCRPDRTPASPRVGEEAP